MEITTDEARAMLTQAGRASSRVQAGAAKEHVPFLGWGAFQALVVPGFDILDRAVWGWVTMAVAVAGFLATGGYYLVRARHVRVPNRSPWWIWLAMAACMGVGGLVASTLDDALTFSYVLGGWIGAAPLLAWGWRLRREQ